MANYDAGMQKKYNKVIQKRKIQEKYLESFLGPSNLLISLYYNIWKVKIVYSTVARNKLGVRHI